MLIAILHTPVALRNNYNPHRLYALRVVRKHGLCDDSLHDVFRAVAVAKLIYARTGFCSPGLADFRDLYIFFFG